MISYIFDVRYSGYIVFLTSCYPFNFVRGHFANFIGAFLVQLFISCSRIILKLYILCTCTVWSVINSCTNCDNPTSPYPHSLNCAKDCLLNAPFSYCVLRMQKYPVLRFSLYCTSTTVYSVSYRKRVLYCVPVHDRRILTLLLFLHYSYQLSIFPVFVSKIK